MMRAPHVPPVVILAAGRGNRLLPMTKDKPKCLLEVGGRTLLEHQVRALELGGANKIEIITGHGADLVHMICNGAATYAHNADFDKTNSFDSLGYTTHDPSRGLLVMNSDVLFHPELLRRLIFDPRENVLLADFREGLGDEEMKIVVDENQRIQQISKKMNAAEAHAENLGVLKLGGAAATALLELSRCRTRDTRVSWVPDGINALCDRFEFHALAAGDLPWTEIDFFEDLERAEAVVFPKIREALWGASD
jgi:choline kinase